MVKFQLCFDKDKEAKWLNEMSWRGYAMTGFFAGFYGFELCRPGEYVYQIDTSGGMFQVSSDYRDFMRETGVEIVCVWGMWVILRKKASEGPFVLYTDVESNIEHYEKIRRMFKRLTVLEILCLMWNIFSALEGSTVGMAGSCILAAIVVTLIREIMRLNCILAELRGRIGQTGDRWTSGRGKPSGVLAAGLLLNGFGYFVAEWGSAYETLRYFCQGVAIGLIAVGIVHTFWQRRN